MKNYTRRGYRIANANKDVKLIYTFFLLFVAIGFITVAAFQLHIIGWSWQAIQQHYLGSQTELTFPRSFLQLLETTHFHAFMMGIIYLTLAHILIATKIKQRMKYILLVGGFVATLLDLLAPWGIRYISPLFIPLLIVGWIGEWLFYLSYIIIPLRDMWGKNHQD